MNTYSEHVKGTIKSWLAYSFISIIFGVASFFLFPVSCAGFFCFSWSLVISFILYVIWVGFTLYTFVPIPGSEMFRAFILFIATIIVSALGVFFIPQFLHFLGVVSI